MLAYASGAQLDTVQIEKKGWNFAPLPVVSYNSDLGFQYGACCDLFNYADGSMFPNYKDHFYVEISRYTKQQTLLHVLYNSDYLIPKVKTVLCASYQLDPMYYFYGYNGFEDYYPSMSANKELRTARYSYRRTMFRFLADFQGNITSNRFRWAAGLAFWHFTVGDTRMEDYDPENALYYEYRQNGLINPGEANGGTHLDFKLGAVYDSRNFEAAPDRGIWAEAYLVGSPDLFKSGSNYLKLCAHFRHYVTLGLDGLVFAYHLAYQGTLAGHTPFYMLNNLYTLKMLQVSSEGLGSANNIRGMMTCRVIGESYAWGNFEFRIRLFKFNLINQSWYVALNPLFDCGMVLKPYKFDEYLAAYPEKSATDMLARSRSFHTSAGMGVKLAMNRNFILSVDAAKPLKDDDGPLGVYVGFNYTF